jgi:hypothetical protein
MDSRVVVLILSPQESPHKRASSEVPARRETYLHAFLDYACKARPINQLQKMIHLSQFVRAVSALRDHSQSRVSPTFPPSNPRALPTNCAHPRRYDDLHYSLFTQAAAPKSADAVCVHSAAVTKSNRSAYGGREITLSSSQRMPSASGRPLSLGLRSYTKNRASSK